MALFQKSVIKTYLKLQDTASVQKAYKKYTTYFHNPVIQENIKGSKEEQYQAKFLDELFVNILGYTMNPKPDYNLTTEFKNQKNNRKADGAFLANGKAVGVIELKGTNTKDLESIRKQAFDYKANQKDCVYVVTSNFEKLRFYINDATEFEEFNLFMVSEEEFALMYLCLHKDHILSNLPLKIKEESINQEEQITKKFYADYSLFKRELFRDLVKQNVKRIKMESVIARETKQSHEPSSNDDDIELKQLEKNVKLSLFKKSQKLIDRFLFIFFAEDRSLLPANSALQILNKWKADLDFGDDRPLFDLFKQYFNYLDSGRKGTTSRAEIYAYNGGLFKPDTILDNLVIDDQLLYKHTLKLASYDFESQVDVNILGHIFENSLNEIESVNAEIEGAEFDKQKSKRKKDGVFYTPKYITKYIVENTVGKLCEEKKVALGFHEEEYFKSRTNRPKKKLQELVAVLDGYRAWLLQLTICDPACGSGAFLNQALDFLIKEHRYIDELKSNVLGGGLVFSDIENTILENNIYGVDLNEESVEIAKLSLWLRTAQPRRKLNDLSSNIKCGNSLIDDKKVAGDKAFNWQQQFPQIFQKGGFDVVIGNPPYGASFSSTEKEYLKSEFYEIHIRTPESFNYFIKKIINISKINSICSVIIPSSFLNQIEFEKTRKLILQKHTLNFVLDLGDNIFSDVATPTCIIGFYKDKFNKTIKYMNFTSIDRNLLPQIINKTSNFVLNDDFLHSQSFSFNYKPNKNLIAKLYKNKNILKNLVEDIATGISPGLGEAFVLDSNFATENNIEKKILKKLVIGGEINRYFLNPISNKQIIYFSSKLDIKDFPNSLNHLSKFKEKLDNRVETKKGSIPWYVMLRPRRQKLFDKPKILIRQTADRIMASYDIDNWYCLKSGIIIQLPQNSPIQYNYLISILNSSTMHFLYNDLVNEGKRVFPEVKPIQLFKLPIPEINEIDQKPLVEKAYSMVLLNKQLIELSEKFHRTLQRKFEGLDKLSKKLESWYELSYAEFIKELGKKKIKLSLSEEAEWEDYFIAEQQKAVALKAQIDQTDREIDAMVYELYGLTEEEIGIVEQS